MATQRELCDFLAEGKGMPLVAKKVRTWSGGKLKALRLQANLTQAQLAEKAEIRAAAVSDYENDKAEPTFTILCRLASALGVELNAFTPSIRG
jgi:transcriptional regulator with XRE-family HTH domain